MASSPVLWQNKERTVILFDIPRSIATAQADALHSFTFTDVLCSSEPLETPYATNGPRSEKAKANLRGNTVNESLHSQYRDILQQALEDVKKHHNGIWCHARYFTIPHDQRPGKRRRLSNEGGDDDESQAAQSATVASPPELPSDFLANITNLRSGDLTSQVHAEAGCCTQVVNHHRGERAFRWNSASPAELHIRCDAVSHSFRTPPGSTAFLADCSEASLFHNEVRQQAQVQDTRRHFDLILLDPPWPNRSVKRARKTPGSTYHTVSTLDDVYNLLLNMDLDMLMADDCLVGIWITNKPAIRELVLNDEYGIFAIWGVKLEEEWLWLKTTSSGEPVTPLDCAWRKPYEVLLLGRRLPRGSTYAAPDANDGANADADERSQGIAMPKQRTIISVPDLHSRKPCLKELLEPLVRDRGDYRALEVFARHLVSSWWSWGNECLKFNWNGYWVKTVLGGAHRFIPASRK